MYEFDYSSKTLRRARKERLSRILRTDPRAKVDSSGYEPPDALDADVKTGMRPVSRRQFKRGGRIRGHEFANEGIPTRPRADRTQRQKHTGFGAEEKPKGERFGKEARMGRASGGNVVEELENRDVRELNRDRVGSKHVGGFAKGGKCNGGFTKGDKRIDGRAKGGKIGGPRPMGQVETDYESQWGDEADDESSGQNRGKRPSRYAGGKTSSAKQVGVDKIPPGDHVKGYVPPVRKHTEKNAPKAREWGEEMDDESADENHTSPRGTRARGGKAAVDGRESDTKYPFKTKNKPQTGGAPAGHGATKLETYDADTDGGGQRKMRADGGRSGYLGDIPGTTAYETQKPTYAGAVKDTLRGMGMWPKDTTHGDTAAPKAPPVQPATEPLNDKVFGIDRAATRAAKIEEAVNGTGTSANDPAASGTDAVPQPVGRKSGGLAKAKNMIKLTGTGYSGDRLPRKSGGYARQHMSVTGGNDSTSPNGRHGGITLNEDNPHYGKPAKPLHENDRGHFVDHIHDGGRPGRASGGRAKGKTNINIIIGGNRSPMPIPVPAGPVGMPPGGPAGLHQGSQPPMPPPGAPPPGAPPPGAIPMARKTGGRVRGEGTSYSGGAYGAKVAKGLGFERAPGAKPGDPAPKMTSAALGASSNLEKRKAYGEKAQR